MCIRSDNSLVESPFLSLSFCHEPRIVSSSVSVEVLYRHEVEFGRCSACRGLLRTAMSEQSVQEELSQQLLDQKESLREISEMLAVDPSEQLQQVLQLCSQHD